MTQITEEKEEIIRKRLKDLEAVVSDENCGELHRFMCAGEIKGIKDTIELIFGTDVLKQIEPTVGK